MPNHVENTLVVSGPSDEVARFRKESTGLPPDYEQSETERKVLGDKEVQSQILNFHSLVPIPDEVIKNGFNGKNPDIESGYNSQIELWGTKWGAYDVIETTKSAGKWTPVTEKEHDDWVCFNFQTAWSPPEPWIKKVALLFPDLLFNMVYLEEGMGFKGQLILKGELELLDETGKALFQDHDDEHEAWDMYGLYEMLAENSETAGKM